MKRMLLAALVMVSTVVLATGCQENTKASKNLRQSQTLTGTYQERLEAAVPYPLDQMNYSTERANLRERLLRENDPAKIGYVYLLNNVGNVIVYFTIRGKVSSTDSQLTATNVEDCRGSDCRSLAVLEAPGDDGSYGPNEHGIFFFTTENVLVEWNGQWLYSDYPLTIKEQPVIGYDSTNAQPSTVGPALP